MSDDATDRSRTDAPGKDRAAREDVAVAAPFMVLLAGGHAGYRGPDLGTGKVLAAALLAVGASASFGLSYRLLAGQVESPRREPRHGGRVSSVRFDRR